MDFSKLNKNLDIFFEVIKTLQRRQKSFAFSLFNRVYKRFFRQFFRFSSVSIIFRLHIKKDNLRKEIFQKYYPTNSTDNEKISKLIDKNINNFQEELNDFIRKSYFNSKLNFLNKKAYDISLLEQHCNEMISNNLNHNNKALSNFNTNNVNDEMFFYKEIYNNLDIEVLFVKRASSTRDKYSGNIAFPGGKFEKADKNSLNTSIRETQEEIGLNIYCLEDTHKDKKNFDYLCIYLCPNIGFDITIDLKNYVSSHIFLYIDLNKKLEKDLILSDAEISDFIFVPIKFFLDLDFLEKQQKEHLCNTQSEIYKFVDAKIIGKQCKIKKLILNSNENFLLFGMTLRKIINVLNSNSNIIKYKEQISLHSTVHVLVYKICLSMLNFFNNGYNVYKALKTCFIIFMIYVFSKHVYHKFADENITKNNTKF